MVKALLRHAGWRVLKLPVRRERSPNLTSLPKTPTVPYATLSMSYGDLTATQAKGQEYFGMVVPRATSLAAVAASHGGSREAGAPSIARQFAGTDVTTLENRSLTTTTRPVMRAGDSRRAYLGISTVSMT